jgi:hypothetical protein
MRAGWPTPLSNASFSGLLSLMVDTKKIALDAKMNGFLSIEIDLPTPSRASGTVSISILGTSNNVRFDA